jgi:putative oxidoreductase
MNHTMHRLMQWVVHAPTDAAPPVTLLIRLMAGGVFVGEGLLKFVFPATLGMGRFHALGIPAPELMATFVGLVEIVGGLLFLLGWFTRLAAIPLMIDIKVAILSTNIPLWLRTSPLPLPPVPPAGGRLGGGP